MNEAEHYPIQKLCAAVHVARSAYYKWLHRTSCNNQQVNEQLVEWIKQHYEERNGILGYRQMTVVLNREHGVHFNRIRTVNAELVCIRGSRNSRSTALPCPLPSILILEKIGADMD